MRPTLLIGIALAAMATACSPRTPPAAPAGSIALPPTIRVQVREGTSMMVLAVPIQDYVAATVLSEVDPPSADVEVLQEMYEVQAVISRTYAIAHRGRHARDGFDLCATTHCQLYDPARLRTSRWAAAAYLGAQRTAGEVLWFQDAPARTLYHADCGGQTSAAEEVWGGTALPYLVSVRDSGSAIKHGEWSFQARSSALRDALNRDRRTAVGERLDSIDVTTRDRAGRAEQITLRGTRTVAVRGEVFREVVGRAFGARSVKSTLLSVARSGPVFTFTGKGFGHGVGLCQAGAFARLQTGTSPERVLAYYFPGTKLVSLTPSSHTRRY